MTEIDTGVLPVGEDDRLIGMITDRDIATRAVAEGKRPGTRLCDVMMPEVRHCFDDDDLEVAAGKTSHLQVRRLSVLTRDGVPSGPPAVPAITSRRSA